MVAGLLDRTSVNHQDRQPSVYGQALSVVLLDGLLS